MTKAVNHKSKPMVSVFCPAFNHEKYISKCLEGFTMQKTDFAIEVFVQDDASTDNTAEIILEYAKNYNFIIPVLNKENIYSKGLNINSFFFENAKGKYLALCEGDDYWIDPYKLQKQVDFLENNPDFSICFHDVFILKDGELLEDFIIKQKDKDIFTINDFINGNFISTPSAVYRHNPLAYNTIKHINKNVIGDYIVHVSYANNGKAKRLKDKMAVYRFASGIWSTQVLDERKEAIMLNTKRQVAYGLNKNHLFIDSWYRLLIEGNQQIKSNENLLTNDFEKYLFGLFDTKNLTKKITFANILKILLLKTKLKLYRVFYSKNEAK